MGNYYLEAYVPLEDGETEELGDKLNGNLEAHNTGVNLSWKPRGAWDETKFVKINDIYSFDDKLWWALQASNGIEPVMGAYWAQIGSGGEGGGVLFIESEDDLPDPPIPNVLVVVMPDGEEEPDPDTDFVQITISGSYQMDGTEDRIDLDDPDDPDEVTITLPLDFAALYKKSRKAVSHIGDTGTYQAVCPSGITFPNGDTSIPIGPGDTLEFYTSRRKDGTTYRYATI